MRIISSVATHELCNMNLPDTIFATAKDYLANGERLKVTEQRLNFLHRCKEQRLFPDFISTGITVRPSLFPIKPPPSLELNMNRLYRTALNQNISHCYSLISHHKQEINKLGVSLSDYYQFPSIYALFIWNNLETKLESKQKLIQKTDSLRRSRCTRRQETPEPETTNFVPDPPSTKVSSLGTSLSVEETDLLALGPNFALMPKINEELKQTVKTNIAQAAYGMRWRSFMEGREETPSDPETDTANPVEPEPQHQQRTAPPFHRRFASAPPIQDLQLEHDLRQLQQVILSRLDTTKSNSNLTPSQRSGLRSLLKRKSDLHISVSDKGGEFVVMDKDVQKRVTEHHIESMCEKGVYRFIPPTRGARTIAKPTEYSYSNSINSLRNNLETEANDLWSSICSKVNLEKRFSDLFISRDTTLPTLYILIKTHKMRADYFNFNSNSNIDTDLSEPVLSDFKVRPIVSCCGSPTEKLAWIVTTILSPLLRHVPSHLSNIHDHLSTLHDIPPTQLQDMSFFSADVVSLYTNIDIQASVKSLIEFSIEHWEELDTWGISATDIHRMLDVVLGNSFFVYANKLYKQLVGLFMGSKPSPLAAIIRVYMFERSSIYRDLRLTFYRRYVDDTASFARSEVEARELVAGIAHEDPDRLLQWEIEFPEKGDWVPFLDAELRVTDEGTIEHRYYRKPQKKPITLHAKSHHPDHVKCQTIKGFYRTAAICSSDATHEEYSMGMVDKLLMNNGYQEPREISKRRLMPMTTSRDHTTTLKLPYISESFSSFVISFIRSHNLPIRVIFTPGTKLRNLFCKSRPYDSTRCYVTNCLICPLITHPTLDCTVRGVVYKITCKLCNEIYVGETARPCRERFKEHRLAARSPQTYPHEALATHYHNHHNGEPPDLEFDILATGLDQPVRRKVSEAILIKSLKPTINKREEGDTIEQFVI